MSDMNTMFMNKAFELAKLGDGLTSPNPCVGAVIVVAGKIIAEGWHKKAGSDHAEIMALNAVKNKAKLKGAKLYVTLEPCCHYGKTPPCVDSIVGSGIKKVFVGMVDPFVKVSGRGVAALKKAGINVEILSPKNDLAVKIRELNQSFLKFVKTGLPYLVMKAGMSLDGKIATAGGESNWITCEKSRLDSRTERSKFDAVIVGANTVRIDNPELKIIAKYRKKAVFKVVLDGKLRLNPSYNIFKQKNVLVVCGRGANAINRRNFEKAGVEVVAFDTVEINIRELLKFLAKRGVQSVFVEGGSETHGAFYDASLTNNKLLDKVIFYIAPVIIGGKKAVSVVGGNGVGKLSQCKKFHSVKIDTIGNDLKYTAILNRY
jgi:diaminohydroxyphosphoribosylaminopyrimidine deaminase/5-amino-6-(5-phosphoribosylamino)uracil reductase